VPQDFTERDVGRDRRPRHEVTLEDILESAYSPVHEIAGNPGLAAAEVLLLVPSGHYAIVTHATVRRAAASNDLVHLEVVQRGDTAGTTTRIVAVEQLMAYTDATPADQVMAMGGSLLPFPLVLNEGEALYTMSGGPQAALSVNIRYILIEKRGEE